MNIQGALLASARELQKTLAAFEAHLPVVQQGAEMISAALRNGGKILACGNGGSAADALHLAEELVGKFNKPRRSLPAISLAADPTLLTCIANDFGFDQVFSRQIEGLGNAQDVLVVFSTSGNSKNIELALQAAKTKEMKSIALLGKDGGKVRGLATIDIIVPSYTTARIQEVHTLILHMWLETLEEQFA
jgi:D-sedoheptulose 7-phosphate isomerase